HRILGEVDVTEDADQGSDRSAGLLAEDPADLGLIELPCGADVAHAVRPRIRVGTGGPRSASRLLRWSSTPKRARRQGLRPRWCRSRPGVPSTPQRGRRWLAPRCPT